MREIEERTGYLKLGVTVVSDSNPGNIARQKEFAIGGVLVTSSAAPEKVTGLRYSAQGWLPLKPIGAAGYLTASYVDYPEQDFDRLTVDAGLMRNLVESGRVRGKAGLEFGTLGGNGLYRFPYVGLDAVLAQSESYRLAGEPSSAGLPIPTSSISTRPIAAGRCRCAASCRRPSPALCAVRSKARTPRSGPTLTTAGISRPASARSGRSTCSWSTRA